MRTVVKLFLATLSLVLLPFLPVNAQDAETGERLFRNCLGCHEIARSDGQTIRQGGENGPNLFGVVGREIGSVEYRYGSGLSELNERGVVWTEALLSDYVSNPNAFVAEYAGSEFRSKMPLSYPNEADDVIAYLALFGD